MSRSPKWRLAVAGLAMLVLLGVTFYLWNRFSPDRDADQEASDVHRPALDAGALEAPAEAPAAHASIRGTVLDPLGKPANGALVWAADAFGRFRQARTGADGAFTLGDLAPSQYHLAAQRGAETSESEGPLPIGAGDDLRGLTLRLSPGARVAGAVLDFRTRAPLPGAVVAVVATPLSAIADDRGRFSLPPLPSGGHVLSVQAEAHLSREVPLQARSGDDTRDLEIYLTPAARLTGQVVTRDGTGVPGAALLIPRYQAATPAMLSPVGQTDNDGRFALNLAPASVQLVARTPGFSEAVSEMLDLTEGKTVDQKLTLGVGAQVDGQVQTSEGAPLAAGQALAYRGSGGWQVGQAPVGPGGRFTLTNLPAGHLVISVDASDARATAEVDVEEAGETSVTLRLGDRVIQGDVVGASGRPVEGARVVARPVGAGAAGERTGLSGPDGSFKLGGLSGERFDVTAEKDEGEAELRGVAAGRRDVRLTLATGGISGSVVGPGGLVVSDFYVAAEPEIPGRGRPRATQAVDSHGEFHLSLSPGRYRLRATAPGYSEGSVDGVEVAAGAETRGVRVELQPAGTIVGLVLEGPSGAPIPGVHVGTDCGHAWSVGRESPLGGSAALSGPDGRFTLRDVAPGTWPLFASATGFEQANGPQATVTPGENPSPIELRMRRDDGSGEKPYAGIGMALYGREEHKFAGEVFEGGPAQVAGIRMGDEILAVDGAQATALNLGELVARIRGPQGSEVTLDMQRAQNGAGYTVVVPRAEIRF